MSIENIIEAIDSKNYQSGVLGKMDAVLRLSKDGYARDKVLAGLYYVARHINNATARDIAIDAYSKRVR